VSGRKASSDEFSSKRKKSSGSDNLCKYLAERYADQFASWLLKKRVKGAKVLKTELSKEPLRADSVILLNVLGIILHIEFQVSTESEPELPLRMLDYWVRLYRKYRCSIFQVVVFLKETDEEIPNQFLFDNTRHQYHIVKIWEVNPQELIKDEGLLPLAVLARTDEKESLIQEVAQQVRKITPENKRSELSTWIQVLAGLRFDRDLVKILFREDIMKESVIYQDILQEGIQQGVQQGLHKEAKAMVLRQLARRFGTLEDSMRRRIQRLSLTELEDLGIALLDFKNKAEVTKWLDHQKAASRNN
jgi:predicted transposase/invertase (TIGR01784 family)